MPLDNKQLEDIRITFLSDIEPIDSISKLKEIEIKYLGKNGQINEFFRSIPNDQKSQHGKAVNQLKQTIIEQINAKEESLRNLVSKIDVTIPGIRPPIGNIHVITQAIKEIEDIFTHLGFVRRRYPEVETDWYAAEGLNIPPDHPARDDQETFYISQDVVLTAHTSNGQLREMETIKTPPIRMINIGKTYRRQIDVSHTPMFHQFEGLLIDEGVNIAHLIGISNYFVQQYFGPDREIRLRPHHFQFTEPSFEVDINCAVCHGQGCRLCKAGWLELGGAGMVHPVVLKNGGIDPKKYSGFAFGWGVERVLSMKYGINDIRNIYTTDLRILKQF